MSRPTKPSSSSLDSFAGFDGPEENWSKLPHQLVHHLPDIRSLTELKVVLYILRHTWGFHQDARRLSQDEFEHGRKKRNGKRMDRGIGMSRNSIRDGLRRAEAHGLITVEEDARDLARVEHWYAPRRANEPRTSVLQPTSDKEPDDDNTIEQGFDGGQELTPTAQELSSVAQELTIDHRKKLRKKLPSKESHYVAPAAKPPIQATFEPEVYDEGLYRGLVVRMVEDGEETFDCPACEERQKWPSRKSRRNFQCSACHEPLAGFLPDDAEPFWKPPKRPLERKDLGTLVPGIAAHLANVPYRTQDKERLLHAMREDSNQMAKCLDWAYRQQMPAHVLVKNALTAYYKPQTVVKHAQREVAKSVKSNLAAGDPGQSPTMSSAYDF